MSPMSKVDAKAIIASVQANTKALKECAGPHNFVQLFPNQPLRSRFRCSLCGGEVNVSAYLWYKNGLEHGAKK